MLDLLESKFYYGSALAAAFLGYYLYEVVKIPKLHSAEGPFREFLEEHVPIIKDKFWPTVWCFESRAQTVLACFFRSAVVPRIRYRREILTLSDGGEVAIDWAEDHCTPTSPLVIILPGLTGASETEYIKCLVAAAQSVSIRCVIFNNRGLGGLKLKTPRLYCASNGDDFSEVLEHVGKMCPHIPIAAAAISMGGLIIGNFLAQQGSKAVGKLKAALMISVPWNTFEATKSIEKPYLNLLLNKHLCSGLQHHLKRHSEKDFQIDLDPALKSKTIREFDDYFTSKHFGYKDVDDYYANATLHDKLHLIEVPVLCLSAADDPFQPLEAIPVEQIRKSKFVAVVVTSRGGHIGFLEGLWPVRKDQYISKVFKQFFTAVFTKGLDHPAFCILEKL